MEEIERLINTLEFSINKWEIKKQLIKAIELYGIEEYTRGFKDAIETALNTIKNYNTEDDV